MTQINVTNAFDAVRTRRSGAEGNAGDEAGDLARPNVVALALLPRVRWIDMAGGQERILKGRIRSMQATKKITRAMELIAGSRIVKAQQRVQAAVPYSEQITEVVKDLAAAGASSDSPLLAGRGEIKNTCYVVITADRGLCGGYNAGVQRAAEGEIKADVLAGKGYEIIPVGRKAESYFKFRDYELGQTFQGFSDNPSYDDAKAIGQHVIGLYASGHVDKVELVYTRFITPGSQEVVLRPLVPLSTETVVGGDGKAGSDDGTGSDYEFEPDPTTILDTLLPRYVEARVWAALLNAAASEHAFRQRAMKSATDNAEELIRTLSITMNRARQASITTEIMEIVGGAEALGGGQETEIRYRRPRSEHRLRPTGRPGLHALRPDAHVHCPRFRVDRRRHARTQRLRRLTAMTMTEPSTGLKDGRVVGIAGPVIDVEFPPHSLPELNSAVEFEVELDGETITILAEVAQQLGHGRIRAVCLKPTDGLKRGTAGEEPRPRHPGAGRRHRARQRLERLGRGARSPARGPRSRPSAGTSTARPPTSTPSSRRPACSRPASR